MLYISGGLCVEHLHFSFLITRIRNWRILSSPRATASLLCVRTLTRAPTCYCECRVIKSQCTRGKCECPAVAFSSRATYTISEPLPQRRTVCCRVRGGEQFIIVAGCSLPCAPSGRIARMCLRTDRCGSARLTCLCLGMLPRALHWYLHNCRRLASSTSLIRTQVRISSSLMYLNVRIRLVRALPAECPSCNCPRINLWLRTISEHMLSAARGAHTSAAYLWPRGTDDGGSHPPSTYESRGRTHDKA